MVNIRERVFLISGNNFLQRRLAIENIKKRILKGKTTPFDVHTFYGKETSVRDLGEKLFTASFKKSRIIVFKNSRDLSVAVRNFLFENLKKILAANYLIFETDEDYYQFQKDKKLIADKLFSVILKKAALFRVVSTKERSSMEDFIGSIRRNDLAASVYILEKLFKGGSKDKALGPQIIGILVRKFSTPAPARGWSASGRRDWSAFGGTPGGVSDRKGSAEKDRYFRYLWEADRAIKEKGLDPRLVIETLLAKIFEPRR